MARLHREVKRLTMERDILKRSGAFLDEGVGPVIRYRRVSTMKAEFGLDPLRNLKALRFTATACNRRLKAVVSRFRSITMHL